MTPRRGKRAVIPIAGIGVLVLLLGAFAYKDRIVEEYYLRQLESDDVETQKAAADQLAEMGSVRAVPGLLRHCDRSPFRVNLASYSDSEVDCTILWVHVNPLVVKPQWIDIPKGTDLDDLSGPNSRPSRPLNAIRKIAEQRTADCLRYLVRALEDDDRQIRERAAVILSEIGRDAAPAIPALETVLQQAPDEVIECAVERLKRASCAGNT